MAKILKIRSEKFGVRNCDTSIWLTLWNLRLRWNRTLKGSSAFNGKTLNISQGGVRPKLKEKKSSP